MLVCSSHLVNHLLPFCGEPRSRERFACSLVHNIGCLSVGLSVYLSVRLSVCLLAYLLVHPFNYVRSFVCWSVCVIVLSYAYSVHFYSQFMQLSHHPYPALHICIYKQIVHAISVGRVVCTLYPLLGSFIMISLVPFCGEARSRERFACLFVRIILVSTCWCIGLRVSSPVCLLARLLACSFVQLCSYLC